MDNESMQSPGLISPEQFAGMIVTELKQRRPEWAKMAIAKILHAILPNMPVRQCLKFLEEPESISDFISAPKAPWIFGRIARVLGETRKLGYAQFPFLQKMPWLLQGNFENGQLVPGKGRGFEEIIIHAMRNNFDQPIESQVQFWQAFSKGFSCTFVPRPQDSKALPVYVFLAANWREAKQRASIGQLYDFVFSKLPKESCPADVDPVDFEERHKKWFEKLCHRNLKLKLAERGRPEELT